MPVRLESHTLHCYGMANQHIGLMITKCPVAIPDRYKTEVNGENMLCIRRSVQFLM